MERKANNCHSKKERTLVAQCSNCGYGLSPDFKFCPQCATSVGKKPLPSWWQNIRQHRYIFIGGIVGLLVLAAFALAVMLFDWDWTGFTSMTGPTVHPNEQYRPAKTLWDVLQLLIVPVILAIGGFWLSQIQKDREQKREKREVAERAEREKREQEERDRLAHAIAEDNQREAALIDYINYISGCSFRNN